MCTLVEQTEASLPPGAWPAWTGSNHDMSRFATRWAGDDPRRVRVALVMMLGLRGTPVLYQGDEIGLGDRPVSPPDLRDPLGVRFWPAYAGRDPMRTPMPWRDADGGGFTAPGVEPWLPIGDTTDNVESQRADPGSMLCLTRDLIALRAGCVDLTTGSYATLTGSGRVWAWQRGAQHVVALNCSDEPAAVEVGPGVIRLATDRTRDGEPITGSVRLGAWEGIVAETAPDAGRSERG
jgi:alpha-glucosidase